MQHFLFANSRKIYWICFACIRKNYSSSLAAREIGMRDKHCWESRVGTLPPPSVIKERNQAQVACGREGRMQPLVCLINFPGKPDREKQRPSQKRGRWGTGGTRPRRLPPSSAPSLVQTEVMEGCSAFVWHARKMPLPSIVLSPSPHHTTRVTFIHQQNTPTV